jgi:hypothetical protein
MTRRFADHTSGIVEFRVATMIGETRATREVFCPLHGCLGLKEPSLLGPRSTTPEIRLSSDTWVQAGMKSRSCIIWVLGLLLAIASVDTVPDPPAVNPRTVSVGSLLSEVHGDAHDRRLNAGLSACSPLQVRWTALTASYEPNLPKDRIVLTRFATDTSPPAV